MLSTSFPRSPWFVLQIVTIIGITSNLSSNSKEPSKYPKVFITDPSNWLSCKLLFRKVGFSMRSQKFLVISVTSLMVSICISKSKLLILTFCIMSFSFVQFFLHSCFCFLLKRLPYWFCFLQLFQRFSFWTCILLENSSLLSNSYKFSQMLGIFPFLFHVHVHNTNIFLFFFNV